MKHVQIRLSDEDHKALRVRAGTKGIPLQSALTEAVADYVHAEDDTERDAIRLLRRFRAAAPEDLVEFLENSMRTYLTQKRN